MFTYAGHPYTPLDFLHVTGDVGILSFWIFLAAVVYAAVVVKMRLGIHYQIAFIPLALMPFLLGICGFLFRVSDVGAFHHVRLYSLAQLVPEFSETLTVTVLATAESSILLGLSFLLFVGRGNVSLPAMELSPGS